MQLEAVSREDERRQQQKGVRWVQSSRTRQIPSLLPLPWRGQLRWIVCPIRLRGKTGVAQVDLCSGLSADVCFRGRCKGAGVGDALCVHRHYVKPRKM